MSEFQGKYINIESLLQVYFWIWKEMHQTSECTSCILLSLSIKYISLKSLL